MEHEQTDMQIESQKNGIDLLRAFGRDVLIYTVGSGLVLVFGFIQTFIIPKYLSIDSYGYWQLFILYSTYVGILHFGFIDGILVRWAGKDISDIGKEIKIAFNFLLIEQLLVVVLLSIPTYFILEPPFKWIGLMLMAFALIFNLATFFEYTAQANRQFRFLTMINIVRVSLFLLLVVILLLTHYLSYNYVIIVYSIAFLIILFIYILCFRKYFMPVKHTISQVWAYGKKNINIGIFILLGNLILLLFVAIDRWMISFFFSIEQFTIYAFALAIAVVIYTLVRAISEVFFPYLSRAVPQLQNRAYQIGKTIIILIWAFILVGYFPLTKLIEYYLPNYIDSLPIMQFLLCTTGFLSIIRILHVNYYKLYRKQRQYFLWGITALIVSAILNLIAIKIWGTLESVAIATVISFGIWYCVNELILKSVLEQGSKQLLKGIFIIICYVVAFSLTSLLVDWFVAKILIYIGFFFFITWLFFSREVKELVAIGKGLVSERQ